MKQINNNLNVIRTRVLINGRNDIMNNVWNNIKTNVVRHIENTVWLRDRIGVLHNVYNKHIKKHDLESAWKLILD
jgi:hypothetical protein